MSRVVAVILAAGASSRLGRPKQLLPFRGTTLLRAVVMEACASRFDRVGVVLGANAASIAATIDDLPVTTIDNLAWSAGMSSSIHAAVAWARTQESSAVLLAAGDQPLLTVAHFDCLVDAHRGSSGLTGSLYGGTIGVPAIFDRSMYDRLETLTGDEGARRVLREAAANGAVASVDWPEGVVDIDTHEDFATWLSDPQ
jgi:molybdenum cofactor cytidylyltransferase